jgi:hypothetical protein
MQQNEYLNVKEISILTVQSERNVRRIIKKLEGEVDKELLYQDDNKNWIISKILLKRFKLQRIRKDKYYALSVDPCSFYSVDDINEIMKFIYVQMDSANLELNYVVEKKKANNQNHIHCFIKCSNKKKLIQCIRLGFSQVSYRQSPVFDLDGWKDYIKKDGSQIITLKNK